MSKYKATKRKRGAAVGCTDLLAFVGIREAIGDPTGKLMQDEVVAVVRKLARLKYCANQLNTIVEGVKNKRWAADGCRLKDTMEWCDFYCALSEANDKVSDGGPLRQQMQQERPRRVRWSDLVRAKARFTKIKRTFKSKHENTRKPQ